MAWSDTYVITINFNDGSGDQTITNFSGENLLSREGFTLAEHFCGSKYHTRPHKLWFNLKDESTLRTKFLTANQTIDVSVTKNGSAFFTGYIFPNYRINSQPKSPGSTAFFAPTRIEAVGAQWTLKKKIASSFSLDDDKVFDATDTGNSIIHQLLTDAGLAAADIASGIDNITTVVDYFYYDDGEGRTYWEVIDTLLYEHGYVMSWTADGKYSHGQWIITSLSSSGTIADENLNLTLQVKKSRAESEAIEVEWSDLDELTDVVLYGENVPFGTDGLPSGITMPDSSYFPVNGKTETVYQRYRTKWAEYAIGDYDIELITASNQEIVWNGEAGITVETENHYSKKSQVIFENDSGDALKLYWFDIRGDAVIRKDARYTKREIVSGTDKVRKYVSRYIFSSSVAAKLAIGIETTMKYGDFTYRFKSETRYTPGEVYLLDSTANGINTNVLITERIERCDSVIYEYVAVGTTEYASVSTILRTIRNSAARGLIYAGAIIIVACQGSNIPNANYVCDASADQTEINAAITAVNEAGGGVVSLTAGTYTPNDEIQMLPNVHLSMDPGTIINYTPTSSTDVCINVNHLGTADGNMRISGGTINILARVGGSCVIGEDGSTNRTFSNVVIDGVIFKSELSGFVAGVFMYTSAAGYTGDALTMKNCRTVGAIGHFIGRASDWNTTFINNTFVSNSDGSGIGYVVIAGLGAVATGNTWDSSYTDGNYRIEFNQGSNGLIANNKFTNLRFADTESIIKVTYGGSDPTTAITVTGNIFDGCLSFENRADYKGCIYIYGNGGNVDGVLVEGNVIRDSSRAICVDADTKNADISNNTCIDNGQLIDRGGCESTTPPMIFGETVPDGNGNGTYERVADPYEGTYAWQLVSDGSTCQRRFTDSWDNNDPRGLIPGLEYTFTFMGKRTAGMGATEARVSIAYYSSGTWTYRHTYITSDDFDEYSDTFTFPAAATGWSAYITTSSDATSGEKLVIDNIRLYPTGTGNEHENQYKES